MVVSIITSISGGDMMGTSRAGAWPFGSLAIG